MLNRRVIGLLMFLSCASSTFIAGCGAPAATTTLSSITVSPNPGSIETGSTEQFSATAVYTNGTTLTVTTDATWTSTNTALATVSSSGLVTAVQGGSGGLVYITATYGDVAGQANVNVTLPSTSSTGSSVVARYDHTATLLPNGTVLLAGGSNSNGYLASAEIYDPVAQQFSSTGNMTTARLLHTATLLGNGQVLIVGGYNGATLNSAELYNPSTGMFTSTGTLANARYGHTATLLSNGNVLITGGFNENTSATAGPVAASEIYNVSSGTFTSTGSLATARWEHTATLLPSGSILVAGGCGNTGAVGAACPISAAELYSQSAGTFTAGGSLIVARFVHTATLLSNGTVLFAGGNSETGPLNSAETYNSGAFTVTGNLNLARFSHTATILCNTVIACTSSTQQVLVTGGFSSGGPTSTAELYNPTSGAFAYTGSMTIARYGHTATLLNNGYVLITGGQETQGAYLSSAELYNPATGTFALTGQ